MTSDDPSSYPRRVLLAVTGLSPQIVTETLYALAVQSAGGKAWIPTEIQLITTGEGAERARLSLLHPKSGWFHRLCRDYGLPPIRFDDGTIHVLCDPEGRPLSDIRTAAENALAADLVTDTVRQLTQDDDVALHVSIAGGRKTMGFYLGYALSLYARPQDRLSHVLVSSPYESHPRFFYPTLDSEVIHTPPPDSRPYDSRDAVVTLAEIPFVSLRHRLDRALLEGAVTFNEVVDVARRGLGPPDLRFDPALGGFTAAGRALVLPPVEAAFYLWLASRQRQGEEGLSCPKDGVPDLAHARAFLTHYQAFIGEWGDDERTARALRHGMDKNFFERQKSRVNRRLIVSLGEAAAAPYLIQRFGRRPHWLHGLGLPADAISGIPPWGDQPASDSLRGTSRATTRQGSDE